MDLNPRAISSENFIEKLDQTAIHRWDEEGGGPRVHPLYARSKFQHLRNLALDMMQGLGGLSQSRYTLSKLKFNKQSGGSASRQFDSLGWLSQRLTPHLRLRLEL